GMSRVQGTAGNGGPKIVAGDELRHEVHQVGLLADLVQRRDAWMRKRDSRPGVRQKPATAIRVSRDVAGDDTNRDRAARSRVARAEHLAHAADADRPKDLVLSNRVEHGAGELCTIWRGRVMLPSPDSL